MGHTFENDFICVSHLPWNSIRCHPEHFPWRFLRKPRILLVEEPTRTYQPVEPYLDVEVDPLFSHVTIARLVLPTTFSPHAAHGDPLVQPIYNRLLAEYIEAEAFTKPILWLATPRALKYGLAIPYSMLVMGWVVQHELRSSSIVG